MYIDLPPKQCRDCGSIRSEIVLRDRKEIRRCRDCGHEKIEKENLSSGGVLTWQSTDTTLDQF
jgi:predicted Zn-ribbon and HTH transcriptional regulator